MTRCWPWSRKHDSDFDTDAWTKKNSDLSPDECEKRGLCPTCGGKKKLWWAFGDEHGATPCPDC